MKIDRSVFLATLETVSMGLSRREILEQSSSFIFHEGYVLAFNDEMLVRHKSPLDIEAVAPANDLLRILAKFPDEEIDITFKRGELVIKGKKRSAGLTCDVEILLPLDAVPTPDKWHELTEGTALFLQQAAQACGEDETLYLTTCVHVTEDLVEASDNFRFFRADAKTGFPKEVLIPACCINQIKDTPPKKVDVGDGWVHFLLEGGAEVSLRCSHQKYHTGLDDLLTMRDGHKIRLPSNLGDILERASIMQENRFDARVTIHLKDKEICVTARKEGGWFRETKKVRYSGEELSFEVHPSLLQDILERTRTAMVNSSRMMVKADNVTFVVCLQISGEGV